MKYQYTQSGGVESIAALIGDELFQATDRHPAWSVIKSKCFGGTLEASDFNVEQQVIEYMKLTDNVYVEDGELYYLDEPMHGVLADKIMSSLHDGLDATPLALFADNLACNPSRNSRDQLFQWLEVAGLEITDKGWIKGYKSVHSDPDGLGFRSVSSGTAYVNGKQHTGQIPQKVGDTVSMDRSDVTDNPAVACSYGLHVGSMEYAQSFTGDTVLEVHVNPADVVSVPQDAGYQKMRVCEYYVDRVVEKPEGQVEESDKYYFQNSSWLKSAEWSDYTLTIETKRGDVIKYADVPLWHYASWVDSDRPDRIGSAGEFYNDEIKGQYKRI